MIITAAEVEAVVREHKLYKYVIRACSMCSYPLGYVFQGSQVGFDAGCDCTTYSAVYSSSYQELADHFNRQTPEVRDRLWAEFRKEPNP